MKIKYQDNVDDGFVVPIAQDKRITYNVVNGEEVKEVIPRRILFLKFLREKDFDEFMLNRAVGSNRSKYGGYIVEDPEDCAGYKHWAEEVYVPAINDYTLEPQQVIDFKEAIDNARNPKPMPVPDLPMVGGGDVDNEVYDEEIRLNELLEEANRLDEGQPLVWAPEPAEVRPLPAYHMYLERDNGRRAFNVRLPIGGNQRGQWGHVAQEPIQPPIQPENDPNAVIPREAERPF